MRNRTESFATTALVVLVVVGGLALIGGMSVILGSFTERDGQRVIKLVGQEIRAEVADTQELRERGLSGREALEPDEGMLFVFREDGIHGVWMKDMRFSIDILWLSSDGTVVEIAQNVSPTSYPHVFAPKVPVRYVLELPAGSVKEYTVHVGDRARL